MRMLLAARSQRSRMTLSFLMIVLGLVINNNTEAVRDRGPRCEKPDYIPNGSYRLRRDRVMRINCLPGFQLQGLKTIDCVRGKWDGEKPVCAKKGCTKKLTQPENGLIQVQNDMKAILYCLDNYNVAGNRHSFCNGTHWDRPIGNCRERKNVIQHECDFETDDICGWTYEPQEGFEWKRVMAANVFTSFKTGPRHDHSILTANDGHYMLMESLTRRNDSAVLTSPIYDRGLSLKTACCFQFYFFMYGAGVGDLFVVVKPISLSLEDLFKYRRELIKFQKHGNQNNIWNEAHFNIEEFSEDFQILFVAKSGRGQLSDIAIDDVRLLTGDDCKALDKTEDENMSKEYDTTTYESIYESQSCVGRCFEDSGNGLVRVGDHLKKLCNCDIDCEDNDSCCPDFRIVCLNELFAQTSTVTLYNEYSSADNGQSLNNTTTSTQATTTRDRTTKTLRTTRTTRTTTTTSRTTTPRTTVNTKTTTVKTTKTKPTTTKNTIKATTSMKTTPTTQKTTVIRTTKITSTTPTTSSTTTTTSGKILSTSKTTDLSTTTSTGTTAVTGITTNTTVTSINNPQALTTTQPLTPDPKFFEYIINDTSDLNSNTETAHKGYILLLYTFIIIAVVILAAAIYRRFGDRAVAWYMIHFKPNNNGDDDSSTITTNFKRPHANSSDVNKNSKANRWKKTKKSSYMINSVESPLVNDDDEDDDDDVGVNGNIALKDKLYTEL